MRRLRVCPPSQVYGRWDGGNTMAIQASLRLSKGKGTISSSDDPDNGPRTTPLTLRRGTEAALHSLCAQLDPSRARRIEESLPTGVSPSRPSKASERKGERWLLSWIRARAPLSEAS